MRLLEIFQQAIQGSQKTCDSISLPLKPSQSKFLSQVDGATTNRRLALPRPAPTFSPSGRENGVRKIPAAKGCKGQTGARRLDFRPDRKCFPRTRAEPATRLSRPPWIGFAMDSGNGFWMVVGMLQERETVDQESSLRVYLIEAANA